MIADDIKKYLDLYRDQAPRQAELFLPGWVLRELAALPIEDFDRIMADVDTVAAQHGLLTPTAIRTIEEEP